MAKIISFVNHKGGVAKTSSTSAVGSILAAGGKRVLMVDLDTQANLTRSHSRTDFDTPEAKTIFSALRDRDFLPVYDIQEREDETFDLVPSNSAMAKIESVMATVTLGREFILQRLLKAVRESYDYILLDCPPSLGFIVTMALTASDYAVIPMAPDVLTFYGLELLMSSINEVREMSNQDLSVLGLFYTRYDPREKVTKAVEANVNATLQKAGIRIFDTKITLDTRLKAAPLAHRSMLASAEPTKSVEQYFHLTQEILSAVGDTDNEKWQNACVADIWPVNNL